MNELLARVAERPIIFTADSVRAILDGTKDQTRRVIRSVTIAPGVGRIDVGGRLHSLEEKCWPCIIAHCPYGKPGGRLWVREPFTTYKRDTPEEEAVRVAASKSIGSLDDLYKWSELPSGGGETRVLYKSDFGEWADDPDSDMGPWKSPIFMPRWASRITLEVLGVRVERLQAISANDCLAEGVTFRAGVHGPGRVFGPLGYLSAQLAYRDIWNSINKKHPWDSNPWVWATTFRRIENG